VHPLKMWKREEPKKRARCAKGKIEATNEKSLPGKESTPIGSRGFIIR